MSASTLKPEFDYYLAHQEELTAKHRGKFVTIKGQKVIGVYNTELAAVRETQKEHKLGTFLVQLCEPGAASHSQTFHSRVAFA